MPAQMPGERFPSASGCPAGRMGRRRSCLRRRPARGFRKAGRTIILKGRHNMASRCLRDVPEMAGAVFAAADGGESLFFYDELDDAQRVALDTFRASGTPGEVIPTAVDAEVYDLAKLGPPPPRPPAEKYRGRVRQPGESDATWQRRKRLIDEYEDAQQDKRMRESVERRRERANGRPDGMARLRAEVDAVVKAPGDIARAERAARTVGHIVATSGIDRDGALRALAAALDAAGIKDTDGSIRAAFLAGEGKRA